MVKYGISNFTRIGILPSSSSPTIDGKLKWALIKYSRPPKNVLQNKNFLRIPGKLRIVHIKAPFSGEYLADPIGDLNFGESASLGTGTITST